jgi:sugar lactone lactonase YvrE
MNARRCSLVAVLAAMVCAVLALSAVPAFAVNEHPFIGSFGGEATPAGSFGNPNGLAIDETSGDLYVADAAKQVIDKVDPAGAAVNFESLGTSALHGSTTPAGSFAFPTKEISFTPAGIAVDNDPISPSFEDIYVLDSGHGVIDKFKSNGEYVSQLTGTPGGPFDTEGSFGGGPYGVAVDTGGNVWVYEVNGAVDKFNAKGVFQSQFSTGCGSPDPGMAVDSVGDVYVLCGASVEKFSPIGTLIGVLPHPAIVNAVAVDQVTDHVFEATEATRVHEFNAAGAEVSVSKPLGVLEGFAGGIAVSAATDELYMSNIASQKVYHWGTLITIPDVETHEATAVEPGAVTFNGVVNPDEIEVTACEYEYGETTAYGKTVKCSSEPGAGSAEVEVSARVEELEPDTTYHFRLVAKNDEGKNAGEDRTVTTTGAPTIDEEGFRETTQTGAVLEGQVNAHGFATTYHFEYGETTAYGTSVPVPDGELGPETADQPVSAGVTGLHAGVRYHFRLVAANAQGIVDGPDSTVTTIPPAEISGVSASDITSSAATLNAEIDPLENDTTYHFEYGPSTAYGTSIPIPDKDIGSGSSSIALQQELSDLEANKTYHYRVVAHNILGTATSPDHTFIDATTGGGLPDGRAYEMVTPPQKNGALIGPGSFLHGDIAEDGSRVISTSIQCFAGAGSCNGGRSLIAGSPYRFDRTEDGWAPTPLSPSATQFEAAGNAEAVSANAGTALFTTPTQPFGEDDWYALQPGGSFLDIGPVTLPSDGALGSTQQGATGLVATADLSHVVYQLGSNEFWPFDSTGKGAEDSHAAYEYSGTGNHEPELVGVSGGHGSTALISRCGSPVGTGNAGAGGGFNALSADGDTAFFTAVHVPGCNSVQPLVTELYARIDESRTVAISEPSPDECGSGTQPVEEQCREAPPGAAFFEGASEDGSRVFFSDTQQLTDTASEDLKSTDKATPIGAEQTCDQTSGPNGCNLYSYDLDAPAGHNLIDVSAGDSSGLGPRVQGAIAISSDGSHVYFVAKGVLTAGLNGQGQSAQPGAENLYVYERDASHPEGHTAFIATLTSPRVGSQGDLNEWGNVGEPANVTPDGRFLVFTSHSALTSDDSRSEGPAQVYRYDSQTGELVRISVGARGFNDNGNAGTGDASIVPPASTSFLHAGAARPDPTMSHDGSYVFFESPVGLTPRALNDVQVSSGGPLAENVYEWEADGVGSCGEGSGCVSLISDGRDTSELKGAGEDRSAVELLGTDATGANVFFQTSDQLVPQDTDTQLDIYDARIGGGFPAPVSSTSCQGEACHGTPPATPSLLTPGSASFNGQGNITPAPPVAVKPRPRAKPAKCKKGFLKKHGKCAKNKRKKKAKRAGNVSRDRRGK